MSIKLPLLIGACSSLFLIYGVVSMATLAETKVGGPRYRQIALNTELVADILPPPAYLVEADLVAMSMLGPLRDGDAAGVAQLRERFAELRADYGERHAYWDRELHDQQLRTTLLEGSHIEAERFFRVYDTSLLPALERGDVSRAEEVVFGELQDAYSEHRRAVDAVVELATAKATADEVAANELARSRSVQLTALLALAITMTIVAALLIGRHIARPVERVRDVLVKVAHGDLTDRVDVTTGDEMGQMAGALDSTMDALSRSLDTIGRLAATLDTAADELTGAADSMQGSAGQAADEAAMVAGTVGTVSEQVAVVAHNGTRLVEAIGEIAGGMAAVEAVVEEAVTLTGTATEKVRRLEAGSAEIGTVIEVIASIAEQTKLLALNATIEAARAGDAGRGFSVVAGEVQSLALQTADATKEVARRIEEVQDAARDTGGSIERMNDIIARLESSQAAIAAAIEEQSVVTRSMGDSAGRAADGAREIAERIADVAHAAGGVSAGTVQTQSAAGSLKGTSVELRSVLADYRFDGARLGEVVSTWSENGAEHVVG